MKLSVCIATLNRAGFLGQTLDGIISQWTPDVEVVVVDGASVDGTQNLMKDYAARFPQIVYRREAMNSGVDQDFDKAVGYARGEYCWLMSDDDLIVEGAIRRVLRELQDAPELVIVNAQVRDKELTHVLNENRLGIAQDIRFEPGDMERVFEVAAGCLSFIGGVVIRRDVWLSRNREAYYGTEFVHVGVIFQSPALSRVKLVAEPLVVIRYGNALWTPRSWRIWTVNWPRLVWSFTQFAEQTRQRVTTRHPATSLRTLLWYRAVEAFGREQLERSEPRHPLAELIARTPARWVNAWVALLCVVRGVDVEMRLYDLSSASCASAMARRLARRSQFPEKGR